MGQPEPKPMIAGMQRNFVRPGEVRAPAGKGTTLARRARTATDGGQDLIDFWIDVMNNPNEKTPDRISASKELAMRGWGRPLQPIRLEQGKERRIGQIDPRLLLETELEYLLSLADRIEERRRLGTDAVDAECTPVTLPAALPSPDSE